MGFTQATVDYDGGYGGKDTTSGKPKTPSTGTTTSTPKNPTSPYASSPTGAPVGTGYDSGSWSALGVDDEYYVYGVRWGMSAQQWQAFRYQTNADPYFAGMVQRYGAVFMNFAVQAAAQNMSPEDIAAEMARQGWTAAGLTPAGGGGGGGYRGGGGGGPSKAQQIAGAEAAIRNQAMTLGYTTITDAQIKYIATGAVNGNWSAEMVNDTLVNLATENWATLTGGTLTAVVDSVKKLAGEQLITISDETARQWAKRMASGELDADGIRSFIQQQALSRYNWASDSLNKGMTMSDLLAPSRDRIAQELELNPGEMKMDDPSFMSMMVVTDDKGVTRAANDQELLRAARKDSRWAKTGNARSLAASAAVMLRNYVEGR